MQPKIKRDPKRTRGFWSIYEPLKFDARLRIPQFKLISENTIYTARPPSPPQKTVEKYKLQKARCCIHWQLKLFRSQKWGVFKTKQIHNNNPLKAISSLTVLRA